MRPAYPIRTERLLLRPFEPGDVDDLHAYLRLSEVARFLYTEPAIDRQASQATLERKARQGEIRAEGDTLSLAVVEAASVRVIGDVLLHYLSAVHCQGEIGFVFSPQYHGRGLAREAAAVMLDLGFGQLGLHRIVARCDARNLASSRLMERLGMRREAHLVQNEFVKGEGTDELVYAIRAREWSRRD